MMKILHEKMYPRPRFIPAIVSTFVLLLLDGPYAKIFGLWFDSPFIHAKVLINRKLWAMPNDLKQRVSCRRGYRFATLAFVVAILLFGAMPQYAQVAAPVPKAQSVELSRLEVTEELSESLANDLLDLSVATRDRNLEQTANFFPDSLDAAPFPSQPTPTKLELKWISSHGWMAPGTAPAASADKSSATLKISRQEFLQGWSAFLSHFLEIEDARFKVKLATFDDSAQAMLGASVPTAVVGATGQARVAFFVIGRNADNQREWARGVVEARFRYAENKHWQFQTFNLASLDSMIATTDLFSEVSEPAGLAAMSPTFGSPGNDSFVYHGAVAADFNNDGWIDLFVCGSDRNYLYLNDGHSHFRDVSHEAGVDSIPPCVAPVALDYDNDGDQDLFLTNVGQQMLLQNRLKEDGTLKFTDVSVQAGVAHEAIGFSAAVGDVNGDGLPDIYVTSYNYYGKVVPNSWYQATNGTKNLLFINQGNGKFKEEAEKWGVDDPRWSYAAEFVDINGDGRLDLYVVNDFGEKALFINKGDHFVDEAKERGVLDPGNGMGVAFGDFNNDGLLDLHVTNMSSTAGNRILSRLFPGTDPKNNVLKKLASGNSLYQNTGNGYFRDVTADVGGLSAGWAWGGGFVDFDNDGWEDIYTPNGFISGKSMKDT